MGAEGRGGPALAERGLPDGLADRRGIVSGFIPYKSEITTVPLMAALLRDGWQTALPVVIAPEQPLVFRAWSPGEPLVPGVWDIPVPLETAPEVLPDVLLVPMLSFDRRGYPPGLWRRLLRPHAGEAARREAGHRHRCCLSCPDRG